MSMLSRRQFLWTSGTVVGAAMVPTTALSLTPNAREDAVPTAQAIDRQLGRLDGKGPILVDPLLNDPLFTFLAERDLGLWTLDFGLFNLWRNTWSPALPASSAITSLADSWNGVSR